MVCMTSTWRSCRSDPALYMLQYPMLTGCDNYLGRPCYGWSCTRYWFSRSATVMFGCSLRITKPPRHSTLITT